MQSSLSAQDPSLAAPAPQRAAIPKVRPDTWIYLGITLLVLVAWWVSLQGWFTSWSRTGYWLGVAGGVSMLALFTYPLRKRWSVTYNWGAARHWFLAHMILGVVGPWLILLHSTFSLRSTNAAVAFFAMVAVALSGVVGRFLHVRLHADARGQQATLQGLRQALEDDHRQAGIDLAQMPAVRDALHAFEARCLGQGQAAAPGHLWLLLTLPLQRLQVERQCKALLKAGIAQEAKAGQWTKSKAMSHYARLRTACLTYTANVQRAAQFHTLERLFSLWHVAHVPFVWVLVACAIFHVVAVHAY